MHSLRRIIAIVVIGILGIQTGALALHVHIPALTPATATVVDSHSHTADQPGDRETDHHGPVCTATQSCFPIGHAAALPLVASPSPLPVPAQAAPVALPSPRHDTLLRPPRAFG
ncbi:hypothetical protein [Alkalilimnicola sp. S0819]|uniref:hypothetical protein n=1 Tax=Alkalilimnicola sp. S0819 TaxID=2613922 RepID=UPI001261EDF3|nr:hypothetical protein [Alkalilimnicola sp. S0819]KAB7623685.1 hypothetical protein F3N43_09210 [Alkalilimnicola sp. S0819]MPQ16813.1 hypothetical protein [Alkalilimnicola sp. S0819]